jgi:precorrin-2 dehydrogenase / sirohydrochlorin ferrochelatase
MSKTSQAYAGSGATLFPMFLKLEDRPCLVVGAGTVGQPKIESLLLAGANVLVIAPRATPRVRALARSKQIVWRKRKYVSSDLKDMFLVIAATHSPRLHQKIYRLAQSRGVLCNSVDEPARCDFFYPAVVRRGPLQIAISTAGASPALAQQLRRQLEKQFGAEYAAWVENLGETRRMLFASPMSANRRRRLLHRLASTRPSIVPTKSTIRRREV